MATEPSVIYVYDIICGWCHIARPAIEKLFANLQGIVTTDAVHARFYSSERAVTINQATIDHVLDVDRDRGPKLTGQHYSQAYVRLISAPGYVHDSHVTSLACAVFERTAGELTGRYREQLQNKIFLEGEDPRNTDMAVSVAARLGLDPVEFRVEMDNQATLEHALERAALAGELLSFAKADGIPQVYFVSGKRLIVLDPYSPDASIATVRARTAESQRS